MKKYAVKVLSGPLKGQLFPLKEKLVFGRKKGDVILKELSVSDPHGKITQDSNNRVMLRDLNSKNGIFIGGEAKITALLEVGVVFTIGSSEFQLIAFKSPKEVWLDLLIKNKQKIKNKPKQLKAFAKSVRIHCIDGPQKGMKFILGYGPRSFGSGCVDVPLLDNKIPDKAFQLIPIGESLVFQTEYPNLYRKNSPGKIKSAFTLNEEETISCGDTKLHIRFK